MDRNQVQAQQGAVVNDGLQVAGVFTVEVHRDGKHGPEVISRRVARNTVVNVGKEQLFRIACNLRPTVHFDQMRIGTSGAAVTSGQLNVLEAEVLLQKAQAELQREERGVRKSLNSRCASVEKETAKSRTPSRSKSPTENGPARARSK